MTQNLPHDTNMTVRLLIKGRVQGVGYRAWCMNTAEALGLKGWVRNITDGSVEALVYGPAKDVEAMIAACGEGPTHAQVAAVERETITPLRDRIQEKIYGGFEQLPTHSSKP